MLTIGPPCVLKVLPATIDPSVREVKKKYVPFYFAVSSSYATPSTPASAVGGAFG